MTPLPSTGPASSSQRREAAGTAAVLPAFRTAVSAMHDRLTDWAAAVEAVGGSASAGADAPDDPRLEAAEEEFEAAVLEFHRAAAPVLGLAPIAEDDDTDLEVEELALHLLVGLPEGASDPARDAGTMVHEAGERLVAQLSAAGYEVPAWQFGCDVELLLDDDDDEDLDDDDDEADRDLEVE